MSLFLDVYPFLGVGTIHEGGMDMKCSSRQRAAIKALWTEAALLLAAIAAFLLALILPLTLAAAERPAWSQEEAQLWEAYLSGDLIRLHVLADSDAPEDQRIKLKVRDALLEAFGEQLYSSGETDGDAVYTALLEHVGEMLQVAQASARQEGFAGDVQAEAGILHLPEKRYGNVVLPEGDYRGLRITLGSGEGKNWWCVLFPQLCLAVSSEGEIEARSMEAPFHWESERVLKNWLLLPQ